MVKQTQNNLSIGQTLKTITGEFKILQPLGKGATGEVFKAQSLDGKLTVAIKVMLYSDLPSDRKTFINEGMILQAMRQAEKKQKDDEKVFVTPDYHGADGNANPPYLIEEFMTGARLSDMLGAGRHLSEKEVVVIGFQLFRALHLLSTELKKNCIDLKLENLWWNAEKRVLKITDWGTLEDVNSAGDARDVLRASLYLYRFVTGRILTEIKGIVNQPVDFCEEWNNLSWGLQEILRRLLHPNPAARVGDELLALETAEDISQAFKKLDDLWQMPEDELIEYARDYVDAAGESNAKDEIENQTISYRYAKTALDIASHRNIENKEYARLNEVIKNEADYLGRAKGLYEAGSYVAARQLFRLGSRLLLSSRLRRWAWLASVGEAAREKNYKKVKENVERAVELMETEQFEQAGKLFDEGLKKLPSEALQALLAECKVFFLIQQAKSFQGRGEFKSASQSYRSAHETWINILEHEEWKFQVGDLEKLAEIVNQEGLNQDDIRKLIAEARSNVQQSIQTGIVDFDAVRLPLWDALRKSPGNLDVYNTIRDIAQGYFEQKQLQYATKTLEIGGAAKGVPLFAESWRFPDEVRHLLETGSLNNLDIVVANLVPDCASLSGKIAVVLLTIHFVSSLHEGYLARARILAGLISVLDSQRAQQMEEKITQQEADMKKSNKEQVNAWISEAEKLLFPFQRDALQGLSVKESVDRLQNRMEQTNKALDILKQAGAYEADDATLAKITELTEIGTALITKFEKEYKEKQAGLQAELQTLNNQLDTLILRIDQLEYVSPNLSKVALPAQVNEDIANFKIDLITNAYDLCSRALQIASADQSLLIKKEQLELHIQKLGDRSLFVIAGESLQQVREAMNKSLLAQANEHYQSGKLDETLQSLKKMELFAPSLAQQKEFEVLKQKSLSALRLRSWEEENGQILSSAVFDAEVLRQAAYFLDGEIDASVIRNSNLLKYLGDLRNNLLNQFVRISQTPSANEYSETLQRLVWVDNIYRFGSNPIKGAKTGKWVNYGKFAKDITNLPEKGTKEKLLKQLVSLPIFADPESASSNLKPALFAQFGGNKPWGLGDWRTWVVGALGIALVAITIFGGMLILPKIMAPVPTQTLMPSASPILPTDTPVATFTPTTTPSPILSPVPTQILFYNYCATDIVSIRFGPSINFKKVSETKFLQNGKCLNFDAHVISGGENWLRIAPGQMLEDLPVGGYWIKDTLLKPGDATFVNLIPEITLTPTPTP
jgi:hypothetical protein